MLGEQVQPSRTAQETQVIRVGKDPEFFFAAVTDPDFGGQAGGFLDVNLDRYRGVLRLRQSGGDGDDIKKPQPENLFL